MSDYTTVNWKRSLDSGALSQVGKTHLDGNGGKTACGKEIPRTGAEVEYYDGGYVDCKACAKKQ